MIPPNRISIHPGEILREEFLSPMSLTADKLAEHIGVPLADLEAVLNERAPITAELAWLLGMAFDTSPEFWLNLQTHHDLGKSRPARRIAALASEDA